MRTRGLGPGPPKAPAGAASAPAIGDGTSSDGCCAGVFQPRAWHERNRIERNIMCGYYQDAPSWAMGDNQVNCGQWRIYPSLGLRPPDGAVRLRPRPSNPPTARVGLGSEPSAEP